MKKILFFVLCCLIPVYQSIYAEKLKKMDPIKSIQSYKNIDNFQHFFSAYTYKNERAFQYQNHISPDWLVGIELKHISGYEKINFPSKIARDFNNSTTYFTYQYAYNDQVRFPFGGIQSKDDTWNIAIHAKYFLFNTPFYINGKISKNLAGGEYYSREILFSDIGYTPFCTSQGLEGSCITSSGGIYPGSIDIKITEKKQFSFHGGLGFFYVFKNGIFLQLEINYLINEKKYHIKVLNNYIRGNLQGVEPISLLDIWINQKYLESKFSRTGRWDPIFYLGYAIAI